MDKQEGGNLKEYSLSDLAQRDGKQSKETWVAYEGLIYDVSSSKLFKEGKHFFVRAGQDLTSELPNAPHTKSVLEKFPLIGKLTQ
jgi:predicted heme/steroid binding protein